MKNEEKFLEFIGTASERAGTLAGKVASIGGKIASFASDGVSAGKERLGLADEKVKRASEKKSDNTKTSTLKSDLAAARRKLTKAEKTQSKLESQLKELKTLKTENHSLVSELDQVRNELSEVRAREGAVRARAAALVSELDDTRSELEETQSRTPGTAVQEDGQSKQVAALESDVAALRGQLEKARNSESINNAAETEERTVLSRVGQEEIAQAPIVEEEIEPSMEAVAQDDEQINVGVETVGEPELEPNPESEAEIDIEEIEPEPMPEVEVTEPVEVTAEDVQAVDFANAADRIIFTRALSEFASHDIATRVDAARAIAGIDHKLSVKILVAHMADEPSAVVRQECIKALTTLEMKEGLSAVESALTDEAASVRLAAVWGVYRLAGAESVPKLVGMLGDNDEGVRRRAITCIGWLGGQLETIGDSQLRRVISALIERLDDPADSIRKATLDALQAVTGKRIAEPISAGQISHKCLIEQWRDWWKTELLG